VLTTAHTHSPRPFADRPVLRVVAGAYASLWLLTALHAADPHGWLLENVLPVPIVLTLAVVYRRWQLSDASYLLCAIFLSLHAVGTLYGYSGVPAGRAVGAWIGSDRNSYDRLVHLAFGLLIAYPAREMTLRVVGRVHPWTQFAAHLWTSFFALFAVCALAAFYEIAEWLIAEAVAPERGAAFLGIQGDPWDAQKDMALAAAGALVSLSVVHCLYRWRYLRPRARALHASLPRVHSGSSGPTHVAGPVSLSSRRGDS